MADASIPEPVMRSHVQEEAIITEGSTGTSQALSVGDYYCNACEQNKASEEFSMPQRKEGRASRMCLQCTKLNTWKYEELTCSSCHKTKLAYSGFLKKERKKGPDARCYDCTTPKAPRPKDFIDCSFCKQTKARKDFHPRQRKATREVNKCIACVLGPQPEALYCSLCQQTKPVDGFSKPQHNYSSKNRKCLDCATIPMPTQFRCHSCEKTMPSEEFSKKQRKPGKEERTCLQCAKIPPSTVYYCHVCEKNMPAKIFSNTQRKPGKEQRKCRECINNPPFMEYDCRNCKKTMPSKEFSKKQRKQAKKERICLECTKTPPFSEYYCSLCTETMAYELFSYKQQLNENKETRLCLACDKVRKQQFTCSCCHKVKDKDSFTRAERRKTTMACCRDCKKARRELKELKYKKLKDKGKKRKREGAPVPDGVGSDAAPPIKREDRDIYGDQTNDAHLVQRRRECDAVVADPVSSNVTPRIKREDRDGDQINHARPATTTPTKQEGSQGDTPRPRHPSPNEIPGLPWGFYRVYAGNGGRGLSLAALMVGMD